MYHNKLIVFFAVAVCTVLTVSCSKSQGDESQVLASSEQLHDPGKLDGALPTSIALEVETF